MSEHEINEQYERMLSDRWEDLCKDEPEEPFDPNEAADIAREVEEDLELEAIYG